MENLDKKYYRIAEVAAIVGVPQSTLRFWESRFRGVIKPRRNAGGTRFYTPADVEAVRMVHYLVKERGLKIDAAIAELLRNREGVSRRFDAIDRLRRIRERLVLRRTGISRFRRRTISTRAGLPT